jgi:hypothetical protein
VRDVKCGRPDVDGSAPEYRHLATKRSAPCAARTIHALRTSGRVNGPYDEARGRPPASLPFGMHRYDHASVPGGSVPTLESHLNPAGVERAIIPPRHEVHS